MYELFFIQFLNTCKLFMGKDALMYAKDQFDENKLNIYDFKFEKMDYLNFL